MYLLLKFLHIGSMFLATALAVGSITMLVLILRTGDVGAIRHAFRFAEPVFRTAGAFYGLGVTFGIVAALSGAIDLTARWLLTAYALVALLVVANLYADRWVKQVHVAARTSSTDSIPIELDAWRASSRPIWSLAAAVAITLAIVYVMVVKPTLF